MKDFIYLAFSLIFGAFSVAFYYLVQIPLVTICVIISALCVFMFIISGNEGE